ncbi:MULTISPECIES: thermonuclease family protein [Bradyrhizobium]|uniref:thermonuclease family protein n=1 Tax=Bradyrhizobium TaxID=374 RepID=UPI001FDA7D5D|nr:MULTISPECIES: thermonuclease family protein [Bradyrhizobium]MCS3448614.1 endonuclease YncB(thermonuclease family) [Bradyrhizobium elkanii]MCS3560243.1 endonuclease YncB(thermonuclease family) [Bradyrhizobium elkanii]MCW2149911.1 endonuclease YncB(thermonuclease family) [Bradyrhizobium elkanii]MCW2360117.1 endonuclease YncB(thermonuclease family) [Bradyrhizobium elkanii]MCW2373642.1 endonuclease YncB(thermonuclease family) [Bradyrhizobium elkanii]
MDRLSQRITSGQGMPPEFVAVRLDRISGWRRLAGRAFALLVIAGAPADQARAGDVAGQASVIDGDTIEIHGTRVRLYGIDAPEHDQLCSDRHGGRYRCGQVAANALDAFIGRQAVACVEVDRDRYGRSVAVCSAGKVDLAEWLVRGGLAVDWPRYSKGDYAAAEAWARGKQSGMWSGRFVEPWRYRQCIGAGGQPNDCSAEGTGGQR